MKKAITIILGMFALIGCTNQDQTKQIKNGQYIGTNEDIVGVFTYSNTPTLTLYQDGVQIYKGKSISFAGVYPTFTCEMQDLKMYIDVIGKSEALLITCKDFTIMRGNDECTLQPISYFPDNRVLDKNGDGIIDNYKK